MRYFRLADYKGFHGGFHVVAAKVSVEPSRWGGSGYITATHIDECWTGTILIDVPEVRTQSSDVWYVWTRSSLNEDDEPWELWWSRKRPWCYADDHALERKLSAANVGLEEAK